jgi:hypothetical protein
VAGDTGKLVFELDTPATSDKIAVGGTLTIGTEVLGFSDFKRPGNGGTTVQPVSLNRLPEGIVSP